MKEKSLEDVLCGIMNKIKVKATALEREIQQEQVMERVIVKSGAFHALFAVYQSLAEEIEDMRAK